MPTYNSEITDKFNQIADFLDIKGANPFRIRAYRQAARTISNLDDNVEDLVKNEQDLTEIKGIGKDLAKKIKEIVETKELKFLQNLKKEMPQGLIELLKIPGLGPQRVKSLYQELNIQSQDDLMIAINQKQVAELDGFGEKLQAKIKKALEDYQEERRYLLAEAEQYVEPLVSYLKKNKKIDQIEIAGSYRRKKETVGDIDILITSKKPKAIMSYFVEFEDIKKVAYQGDTRTTVYLRTGLQVDLRVVKPKSYGAALMYFTGSKHHNIELRKIAQKKGYKVNEYGVFSQKNDDKNLVSQSEKKIYEFFGLNYIEPELREDRGELTASKNSKLPNLVKVNDIKGDLQMHSTYSDGMQTIAQMAKKAHDMGYHYIAITDHSQYIGITKGMDSQSLKESIKEIDQINQNYQDQDFLVLKSAEVDILKDGSLAFKDKDLARLDIVICSVHSNFHLDADKQTERIITAMKNPYFNIFAHPTGRILNQRKGYEYDFEKVIKAAKTYNCFFEINAHPSRLDLDDVKARAVKKAGIKLSISTDAHNQTGLKYIKYGVNQARRAWLEKDDVLNTRSWKDVEKILQKNK